MLYNTYRLDSEFLQFPDKRLLHIRPHVFLDAAVPFHSSPLLLLWRRLRLPLREAACVC